MTILRIKKCKYCHRYAELVERNGGWNVVCYYAHPIHAAEDNKPWCNKYAYDGILYETPNEAIVEWNKINS
jgi:hypothetical protein